jgi:hypothetical protein
MIITNIAYHDTFKYVAIYTDTRKRRCSFMEQVEGNTIFVEARLIGGSAYLLLSDDIISYLGFDKEKQKLVLKFDKGKHGRFVGVGVGKRE